MGILNHFKRKSSLRIQIEKILSGMNTGPNFDRSVSLVETQVIKRCELLDKNHKDISEKSIMITYIEVVIGAYQEIYQELQSLEGPHFGLLPVEILKKYGKRVTQKEIFDEAMKSAVLGPFASLL